VPPLHPGRDIDASDKASKGEPAAPPYNEPRRTGDDLSTTRLYGQHEALITSAETTTRENALAPATP
jgi:hypothetical protein